MKRTLMTTFSGYIGVDIRVVWIRERMKCYVRYGGSPTFSAI
jgi:hypothetical protein